MTAAAEVSGSARLAGRPFDTREGARLVVRHCRGFAELDACVDLQQEVWAYPDRDVLPRKGFVLAQELGGQVIGAFLASGELVAFAMAMAALEPVAAPGPALAQLVDAGLSPPLERGPAEARTGKPQVYLHSHMLAVRPEYRNGGLGARLKLVQREDALDRGIKRMTWTFDPLAAKNAYLNLHRLGAIARRYSPDFYGVSSSRLHGALPTDRLHAEWWLGTERVAARVAAILGKSPAQAAEYGGAADRLDQTLKSNHAAQAIHLPCEEAGQTPEEAGERAAATQEKNRRHFLEAFANGLAATDFLRDTDGNGIYQLSVWPPQQRSTSIRPEDTL